MPEREATAWIFATYSTFVAPPRAFSLAMRKRPLKSLSQERFRPI
jgi:hypothetical protein